MSSYGVRTVPFRAFEGKTGMMRTVERSWIDGLVEADPTIVGIVVAALVVGAAAYVIASIRRQRRGK